MPGWCLGGGLEFAAACDFRVAAHDAKFAMPEVRVGIPTRHPCRAAAAADRLGPRALADHDRRDDRCADRADWGLVDVVAPEGGLDAAIEETVAMLLECGPQAMRAQKALLKQWEELPLNESVDLSIERVRQSFLSGEPHRMMQGFIDRKRMSIACVAGNWLAAAVHI